MIPGGWSPVLQTEGTGRAASSAAGVIARRRLRARADRTTSIASSTPYASAPSPSAATRLTRPDFGAELAATESSSDPGANVGQVSPTYSLSELDAVAWLRGLPAGSVDLVVTDPPYESLEKHRAIGTT